MSIRTKLLLLSLATLALPWAGCQYAREMESSLRDAEQQALLAVATTLATSLQGRSDLLFRNVVVGGNASAATNTGGGQTPGLGAASKRLVALPLGVEPALDASANDWPNAARAWREFGGGKTDRGRLLAGAFGRYLFLQIEVSDSAWVLDRSYDAALESAAQGDRLWLAFDRAASDQGENEAAGGQAGRGEYFVSAASSGVVRGRRIERGAYGQNRAVEEPRIAGAWGRTASGWRVELRIPLAMLGARLGVVVDDRDVRGSEAVSFGSLEPRTLAGGDALLAAAPVLSDYLEGFRQPGMRIAIGTLDGRALAEANALPVPAAVNPVQSLLSRLYRRLLERSALAERTLDAEPGRLDAPLAATAAQGRNGAALLAIADTQRLVVSVAAPIRATAGGAPLAVLQVAQTSDRWLSLRDRALTRLMNLTLLVTAVAFAIAFWFASWLAKRLIALRDAARSAVTRDGRIAEAFPGTAAPDELGDVARSFAALLREVGGYTQYLRTLAGKLAHEIRTPLTVVRSSLDNLESEPLSDTARSYTARARAGSERLGAIVVAMGAASRVEEAIAQAERSRFDLSELLRSARDAYALAFSSHRFELRGIDAPLMLNGAPDLVLQMLDKLIENAVDFAPPGSIVTLALLSQHDAQGSYAQLDVENRGPALPAGAEMQLFESLWQSRDGRDHKPHFGLGLYIVRLIAEFHRGSATAMNLPDAMGVRFRIRLAFS